MALFNTAFEITMGNEGGYCDTPGDSGGQTYKGVARNYWPNWSGWPIVDSILSTHPSSINTALAANAELQQLILAFYKSNFWDTESLDSINDQQIGNQLFDTAVNMGTGIASRFLQEAVNALNPNALTVDGQVGPQTIAAANNLNAQALYDAICQLRKARYLAIIQENPSQAQFENSWFSRITPYKTTA